MSCTDNTAVVTGGVGGVMGLIILIQSAVIVILRQNTKNRAKRLEDATQHTVNIIFTSYRTSTEDEHKMVVTSSNEAYGVVSVREEHEYDVIGLQQTHSSTADPSYQ